MASSSRARARGPFLVVVVQRDDAAGDALVDHVRVLEGDAELVHDLRARLAFSHLQRRRPTPRRRARAPAGGRPSLISSESLANVSEASSARSSSLIVVDGPGDAPPQGREHPAQLAARVGEDLRAGSALPEVPREPALEGLHDQRVHEVERLDQPRALRANPGEAQPDRRVAVERRDEGPPADADERARGGEVGARLMKVGSCFLTARPSRGRYGGERRHRRSFSMGWERGVRRRATIRAAALRPGPAWWRGPIVHSPSRYGAARACWQTPSTTAGRPRA